MEASNPSSSVSDLMKQADAAFSQLSKKKKKSLKTQGLQAEILKVESALVTLRQNQFAAVDASQIQSLEGLNQRIATYLANHQTTGKGKAAQLLTCYSMIHKIYLIDLSEMKNAVAKRDERKLVTASSLSTNWKRLVEVTSSKKEEELPLTAAPPPVQVVTRIEDTAYQAALASVKSHLDDLANPKLREELVGQFEQISLGIISGREGILAFFSALSLPSDTNQLIENYNSQIRSVCRTLSPSQMEKNLTSIKEDISLLARHKALEVEEWPQLTQLFSIPEIKKLNNTICKEIIRLIKGSQTERLRIYLTDVLTQEKVDIDAIDEQLKLEGSFNLDTLIGDVIEQRPTTTDGIVTHWDRPLSFFVGKSLIFGTTPPIGNPTGLITEAIRLNNATIEFHLDSSYVIRVTRQAQNYKIELWKELNYRLYRVIQRLDSEGFFLTRNSESSKKQGLREGFYTISYIKPYPLSTRMATLTRKPEPGEKIRNYSLYYTSSHHGQETVSIYSIGQSGYEREIEKLSRDEFLKIYGAKRFFVSDPLSVDADRCERLIAIREDNNEARIKNAHRKAINASIEELRSSLLEPHHQPLLHQLVDAYMATGCKELNISLRTLPNRMASQLEDISNRYKLHLQMERSPHLILKQVVLEAVYEQLEVKEDSVKVANAMALLQQADFQSERLRGHDGVVVMGNTGAGKSALIAYLLKAVMKRETNAVGDTIFKLSPKNADTSLYPSIGQSLGTSETLYAQGYAAQDLMWQGLQFVDCAGFNETRGTEWELCANLSMDQAVNNLQAIRSILIVCPFSAIKEDRANQLLDLIFTVQEKFRDSFVPGGPLAASMHLLITKVSETGPTAMVQLGERINTLISEIDQSLKKDNWEQNQGADHDANKRKSLEGKRQIWLALQEMHTNRQIHFVDLLSARKRNELIACICPPSSGLIKNLYQPALATPKMRTEFGNNIELSTETWVHIFKEYREAVPGRISQGEADIELKKQRLKQSEEEKIQRTERFAKMGKEIEQLEAFIKDLEKARKNPKETSEEIYKLLALREKENSEQELSSAQKEHSQRLTLQDQHQSLLAQMRTSTTASRKRVTELNTEIPRLRADIEKNSTGHQEPELWNLKYEPGETVPTIELKDNKSRLDAFNEVRDYRDDEIASRTTEKVDDRDGDYLIRKIIDADYRLVPTDPALLAEFNKVFKASGATGLYEAKITGQGYSIDLGVNTIPSGKKIIYSFRLHYRKGAAFPHIKITHRIPSKEFFAATIKNLAAQLERAEQELARINNELNGDEPGKGQIAELNTLEEEAKKNTTECEKLSKKIKDLSKQVQKQTGEISTRLEGLLEESGKKLKDTKEERIRLEDHHEIDERIAKIESEIKGLERALEAHRRKKRHLALTIKTRWDMIGLLRKFADLSLLGNEQKKIVDERGRGIITACETFMQVFDATKDKILALCEQDLK